MAIFRRLIAALLIAALLFPAASESITIPARRATVTYDYDAFGNLIHSTGTTPNSYLHSGEQFDPDLNLYYNRARYLSSSTARFLSMDDAEGAIADPASLHKYLYTGGSPIDRIDPSGNAFEDVTFAMAISYTIAAMNVYSAATNTITGVQSSVAAYSYYQDDDPWNGTMAVGAATVHYGLAFLNAFAAGRVLRLPPPPPAVLATTTVGSLAVQQLWLNPLFVNWTFELLWPTVTAIGGTYFASAAHTAEWELRDSRGRIKTRGNAESGGTGKSNPTIDEQLASHTEIKILNEIENNVQPGDILTIRGSLPPCAPRGGTIGCAVEMAKAAARLGIKILYSTPDKVWQY